MKVRPFMSYQELQELERLEEERQKEALRKFLQRERAPVEITGKQILWFFAKVLIWATVGALFVIGWLSL